MQRNDCYLTLRGSAKKVSATGLNQPHCRASRGPSASAEPRVLACNIKHCAHIKTACRLSLRRESGKTERSRGWKMWREGVVSAEISQ